MMTNGDRDEYNVRMIASGLYGVEDENGTLIADGFQTHEAAWRWIDKNTDEGIEDTERSRRIRTGYSRLEK